MRRQAGRQQGNRWEAGVTSCANVAPYTAALPQVLKRHHIYLDET